MWIGEPLEWVLEIKMARFRGDNGKPDDTAIKDVISPFRADRSAYTDAVKLAESGFDCRWALLVYGFDDSERPLDAALAALERLIDADVVRAARVERSFAGLVHPVLNAGAVAAWEIRRSRYT